MAEKGLKIIQLLDQLNIDQALSFIFSPVNIYLNFKNGKSTLILRSGDLIEKEKFEKYKDQQSRLYIEKIINTECVEKISQALIKFDGAKLETEKLKNREEFIQVLKILIAKNELSTFDLAMAFNHVFNQINENELKEINSHSVVYLRRSFFVSSLYTCLAIFQGVNDYNLLNDMYHMSFLQDISLAVNLSTYNIEKLFDFNSEREFKGDNILDKSEWDFYSSSLSDSKKISTEKFRRVFNNIEFCEVIDRHLESSVDRSGPKGLMPNELSDYETLLLEVNALVGISNIEFRKNDFSFLVNKLKERCEFSKVRGVKIMFQEFEKLIKEEVEAA